MAEKVKTTGVSKESGYLYYLDKVEMLQELKWLEALTKVAVLK